MIKKNYKKYGALLFVINSIIYLTTEFIAALGTKLPLSEVYLRNYISSLGVYPGQEVKDIPQNFSPLALIMNIGFIFTGVGFILAFILLFSNKIKYNKIFIISIITTIIFGCGSILVGLFQGGVPSEEGIHGIGARMSFLGGNITLILIGIFFKKYSRPYTYISLFLGIVGFASAIFMNNAINNNLTDVVAIYERMTVYPITLWQLITGIYFLFNKKQKFITE